MKKVFLMLIMVFSFTFVANASNTVEKNVTPTVKHRVTKPNGEKEAPVVTVRCADGRIITITCDGCTGEQLLNMANGICDLGKEEAQE